MLTCIFWSALFLTVYTYLLFPILLAFIVKIRSTHDVLYQDKRRTLPRVAVLCAMYNEEKVASAKIDNFLKLEYDDIKLYVGSDGSTDGTNAILRKFTDNEKIYSYEYPRRGKVYVINDLMEKITEEIVVFTDANSMFETDAISALIKHFNNPEIGAVCGRLKLLSRGRVTGEGFYWKYETAIKKLESDLNCVIGANGAIFAVLKKLLKPLPISTINDDFTNSMRVLEQGYGVEYAEDAIACEEIDQDDSVEFKRHIRDGAGHYKAIVHLYPLLNPFRIKIFFLYTSHRIIRWCVPFFMVLLLILPIFIEWNPLLHSLFIAEIALYLTVVITWLTKTKRGLFYFLFYFVYINVALLIGFFRLLLGVQKAAWTSTKR